MIEIGRGMPRDVEAKLVDAKKKHLTKMLLSFESFNEFLECILSQTTPSKSTKTHSLIHLRMPSFDLRYCNP